MNFYRVPGDGWTIELLLQEGESPEDVENADGWVTVHGEGQWAFTLLTIAELGPLGPTLNQVEDLINTTVRSAVAFKSGATRLVFSNGHHLNTRETPAPPLRVDGLAVANHLFDNGIHTTTPMEPVPEG